MSDHIQSFLAEYGQSDTEHIPHQRTSIQCCCGNDYCAYLKHNQSALDGLERDVSTAARLGKALLVRHESYIADSERERKTMTAHIEMLEAEKQALEKRNATVIEENRNLLDQLETLNTAVSESDAHVTSLQATLQSTQQELHKLSQLAARTELLEQQLADFEREQATWQSTLDSKEESEKSAVRRWQKAERTLASIQEQIERIEREAKEERDRHAEIVARMERRHEVEKELGSAAGRLKGAAALKKHEGDGAGTNVVSHFVKDILQDNANLQMGIVELREMLNNSNEEVESLRNKLSLHQPAHDADEPPQTTSKRRDLSAEMSRANSQELHVHHHYHATPAAPKPQPLRRTKKKRYGAFTPPSGTSTPRSSFSYSTPTPTATILQQTAASVPQPISRAKRWSTQSSQTYHSLMISSGPSSPQSTHRTSSIFDRVFSDNGHDSSRPTTPDTEEPGSPGFVPGHGKRPSSSYFRNYSAPLVPRQVSGSTAERPSLDSILSVEELPKLEPQVPTEDIIPEENETDWENASSGGADQGSSVTSPMSEELKNPLHDESFYQQPIRRAASHESLLSISGMDIHTLKARPSQLLAPYNNRGMKSQAVFTDATVHAARPAAMSRPSADSRNLLSGMAADQRQPQKPGLGTKVGGWVFGRWGATPALTTTDATSGIVTKPKKPPSVSSGNSDKTPTDVQGTPKKPIFRSTGINQSGPLIGFFPEVKTPPTQPVLRSLDEEALKDLLNGK